ncbi:MAG TPA: LamG-like jellyroll fold domain-containing protein, partial [Planctomycetaceae bacterium]|nr:LamG-like jellyroll fold domain-containing protein [Planctomycetaceae bacterium]
MRSAVGVDIERDARRLLPRDLRADGFSNTAYSLGVDLAHIEAYATLAKIIVGRMDVLAFAAAHAPTPELAGKLRASADVQLTGDELRDCISGIGTWLLRGPLDEREIAAGLGIATAVREEGGDSAEALRFIVEAMLQSPRFLYRIERQQGDGAPRRVGAYELASRLSYILWGGPPDKELLRAAQAGELSDRGRVEAQVRRMLEDPRAITRSLQFIYEWMDLDRLATLRPDSARFPNWSQQLAADMRDETLAFFEGVAWTEKRPLWELMNAKVTYATPRLARHYGLDEATPRSRSEASGLVSIASRGPVSVQERVTAGLQALYTFKDGGGVTVRDVSRAGAPLDLTVTDPRAVRWTSDGLVVSKSTLVSTRLPPKRLVDAVGKSNALSLEAWITPADASQTGPARIVTFSADSSSRNVTLGQEGGKYEIRLRTTATSVNGTPALVSPGGAVHTRRTHVVYTRDAAGKAKLYVDGQESAAADVGGDLSNWEPQDREAARRPAGLRLAFGNELTKDRPWRGTLHLVAFYDRALSADEVQRNHAVGAGRSEAPALASASPASPSLPASPRVTDDLQALYTFDENGGDTIHDVSKAGEPLNFKIENASAVKWVEGRLTVNGPTLIATAGPAKRLTDAVKNSKAVSIEAWVTPADTSQAGPARIVSLSGSVLVRNFTLGQDGDKFDVRFRTTKTDASGLPSLSSPAGAVRTRLTHVVYTRDPAGRAKLYIDGQERAARDVGNDLSNWDDAFRLALANEISKDRAWRGTFDLVAIYSRALSADDVRRNHAAGAETVAAPVLAASAQPSPVIVDRGRRDLQVLYTFDQNGGDVVHDSSESGDSLDLKIENASAVKWAEGQLTLNGSTLVATPGHARRLTDAVKQSRAITLEAWITPGEVNQTGPARILTLSSGIGERNFTLGQDGDKFDVRFRGAQTDANGSPSLSSPSGAVQKRLTHVVYTRDPAGQAKLYIDGQERAARSVPGDLSNWDSGYRLAIGNETSKDRPWRGTFHRLAIDSRALSAEEIRSEGGLARYDLAAVPARGGLLTQGSVLTIGGDEASMVTRGLFVFNDLLYSRVGNPPPCVDTTPVPTKPGMSQRAIAETRLADQSCSGCHSKFEPLAFSLEKFDGTGAFHDVDEHGNKLREDGQIVFPGEAQPVSYQTTGEFLDLLAGSERVRRGITRKLTQFAIGRPLVETDGPVVDKIHQTAQEAGGTYAALMTAIVMSDLVQRTGTEA